MNAPKSLVLFTTDDWLQATIGDVKSDGLRRELTIIVSGEVDEISFKEHSHIRALKILRAGATWIPTASS